MLNRQLAARNLREFAQAWEAEENKVVEYPIKFLEARHLAGRGYQDWYTTLAPGFSAYGKNTPGATCSWSDLCGSTAAEHVVFWCFLAAAIEDGAFE